MEEDFYADTHKELVKLIKVLVEGFQKYGASPEELRALAELVSVVYETKDY